MDNTPTKADCDAAKTRWNESNPQLKWEDLPTRKKNKLAKNEMYLREHMELSDAISNFRNRS